MEKEGEEGCGRVNGGGGEKRGYDIGGRSTRTMMGYTGTLRRDWYLNSLASMH
jgi:hypothetical protein